MSIPKLKQPSLEKFKLSFEDRKELNKEKWGNHNVRDEFKELSVSEIKNKLKNNSKPFSVMMSQINGDFNFGSVIRSANALGAKEVFYYGKRHYDKRSSVGTYNYTDVRFLSSIDEIQSLKKDYSFIGLENNINYSISNINDFIWPHNSLIIIGEENSGLSEDIIKLCDFLIEIPIVGSIRSFNAAVAASIAMYDFVSKFNKNKT